ncbi:GNAT family N-acetyltransferase [Pseudogulbenkiania subflava]|uniref:Acetyltransferase, GNAT family n=1 Tax=Pseudogulbenkiania subflava DSM 22618 TaxID=1123014 RepID=A0A1Y6BSM1_9NEIS|nr:GNAT family N-acetyltransferase [Pseudogulbenkiania subflava]SMF24995.1 Acetyltransferase, GNAT family [Pseudogulbenkiania subflava DSM 22618]
MSITLATLAEADLPACHALFVDAVHVLARRHYSEAQCTAWAPPGPMPDTWRAAWARRLACATGFKAVEVDGVLAGFAWLSDDGEVDMLYVAPHAAGQGVASRLIAELERVAQQAGLSELSVYASHTARPVFERAGFVVESDHIAWRDGVALDNWIMKKALP